MKARSLVLVIASTLLFSGCAESTQRYAANKDVGAYFTVPTKWIKIDAKTLRKTEVAGADAAGREKADLVLWQEAYSKLPIASTKEIFGINPTSHPIAFARVRQLTMEESNGVSLNSLRDLIIPVTKLYTGESSVVSDFILLDDEEIVEKGARGVRTTFSFTPPGSSNETVKQTSLISEDRSTLYFFIVRCTSKCFKANSEEIDKISDSFTVRGAR
jgi:hypothetical protein